MRSEMLFQDLAPAYLTDLKPHCNIFLRVMKMSPLRPAVYHNDEQLSRFQKNCGTNGEKSY